MRIGEVQGVSGVYSNKGVKRTGGAANMASKKDSVSFSGTAKDYQIAMRTLKDLPNIRQDKVNELVDKYEAGNYSVDGKETADKIFKSIVDSRA